MKPYLKGKIDILYADPVGYAVTLCFIPYQYMSSALSYCQFKFGEPCLETTVYGALYSRQDPIVTNEIISQLKLENPRIRLIFTSSISGMGFDSPCIVNVIHTVPPRNISQYLQEIGRAGRLNQCSYATLYWSPNDIKSNLPGIKSDIQNYCKSTTCLWQNILNNFGFKKGKCETNYDCCTICSDSSESEDEMSVKLSQVSLNPEC